MLCIFKIVWGIFLRNYIKFGPMVQEMLLKEKFMHNTHGCWTKTDHTYV